MPPTPDFSNWELLPPNWAAFLDELDKLLAEPVELHCLGGFVVTIFYGVVRDTGDIDSLLIHPREEVQNLLFLAGRGSDLSKKYKLYLQDVGGIADYPENYEDRLENLWPGRFTHLWLRALEIHDLVLTKLTRNSPKDRFDVGALAKAGWLNPEVLKERYQSEVRLNIMTGRLEWHDQTLQLWLEEYFSSGR
jgi:hypothetical protein